MDLRDCFLIFGRMAINFHTKIKTFDCEINSYIEFF
jgi:hypothetical protein